MRRTPNRSVAWNWRELTFRWNYRVEGPLASKATWPQFCHSGACILPSVSGFFTGRKAWSPTSYRARLGWNAVELRWTIRSRHATSAAEYKGDLFGRQLDHPEFRRWGASVRWDGWFDEPFARRQMFEWSRNRSLGGPRFAAGALGGDGVVATMRRSELAFHSI